MVSSKLSNKTLVGLLLGCTISTSAFVFPHKRSTLLKSTQLSSSNPPIEAEIVGEPSEEGANRAAAEIMDSDIGMSSSDKRNVVSLIEDDEWEGLSMELGVLITTAVREDLKKSARDFLGKDDYAFGDMSKEIDARVKLEVARLRDKDEYELGDLSLVLDQVAKDMVCKYTGKGSGEYEFGDLSVEIDKNIKQAVANFCGKDEYVVGDLTREITRRASNLAADFAGKDIYEFGDVSRELNRRREAWVKDFIGDKEYEFGDVTKKAVANFTGKDEYEFGDVTKKVLGGIGKFLGGNKPERK